MANEQNLIPGGHKLTREESSRGGIASGVAKRKKRELREACIALLEQEITAKDGTVMTGAEAISTKLFKKAIEGDIKAFEVIRDTAGQRPVDKVVIAEIEQSVIDEVESLVIGMPDNAAHPLLCKDKNTGEVLYRFKTAVEASEALGIDGSNISKCISGKVKTAGGYVWEYEQ